MRALAPARADFTGLLTAAVLAAVLANLVNNLPATLMVVPLVAGSPGLVMAVLLGVDVGPNLTYVGSLATLLWRQFLHAPTTRRRSGSSCASASSRSPPACWSGWRRCVEPDSLWEDVRDGAP